MEEGAGVFLVTRSTLNFKKKEETIMTKISKIIALTALITFAFGMTVVGDAVAGEKYKGRSAFYTIKWEQVNVPGEEGHIISAAEYKGISTNTEGKTFGDGWIDWNVALNDINVKTGLGSAHGYGEFADRDGNKIYYTTIGRRLKGELWASYWKGEYTLVKGTGKFEGIKGKGTWTAYVIAPKQFYTDWEIEVELP